MERGNRCNDEPPDGLSIARSNNNLGMRMYRSLINHEPQNRDNAIISPYSLLSVLTLAMLGTKGITKNQIRDALHLPCKDEDSYYGAYLNTLNSLFRQKEDHENELHKQFTLEAANRIYVDKSLDLAESYKQKSSKFLNAEPIKAPFFEDSELARARINEWVKIKTKNKITNMLAKNTVNTKTKMVLVNAMYLNASWSVPFSSSARKRFYNPAENLGSASETSTHFKFVDMMTGVGKFVTGSLPSPFDARLLVLPYQSDSTNACMLIILPNNSLHGSNLEETEEKITRAPNGELSRMITNLYEQQESSHILTRVEMPKFRIETEVNLQPTLVELGVKSLFDPITCNFSAMIKDDTSGLKVDSILQKAYISTDLHGTEAAAATSTISKTSFPSQAQNDFVIDRPFIFMIRANGINLFIGKVYRL